MRVRSRHAALVTIATALFLTIVPARLGSQTSRSMLLAIVIADDAARTPLGDAEVTLTAIETPDGRHFVRSVRTDEDGMCAFGDLPHGQYTLRAGKPGYVTAFFGATASDVEPTPIAIDERARTSRLEMKLSGGGAISGSVRNARGSPAAGAAVLLMQFIGGDRRFARMSGAATAGAVVRASADSSGAYRLYGLPPGEYVVQATSVEPQLSTGQPLMSRGYYGGTADIVTASVVNVSGGQESGGIDIRLQPMTLADVSGSIVRSIASTRRPLRMLMFPQGLFADPATALEAAFVVASPDGLFSNPVTIEPDGTFNLRGVPPGQYELWVRSVPVNEAAEDDPGPAQWGHADVAVGTAHVANVVVSLQDAVGIAGRVALDGGDTPPSRMFAGGSVVLSPTEPPGARSRALRVVVPLEPNGAFRMTGVTPGRYTVDVRLQDPSWLLTAARSATRDLFEAPIEVRPEDSIADAVLTMSKVRQHVSGTLTDTNEQPLGGIRLVVFPDDRRLWLAGSRRIRTAKTATDGTFSAADLPAGEYRVAAITTSFTASSADADTLHALRAASVPFTLLAGDRKVVNIRLAR